MLGLMCVAFLSACDKPVDNPDTNVNNPEVSVAEPENNEVEEVEVYGKTSLNSEELDELEQILLPTSYKYEKYSFTSDSTLDSGEYTYNA